MNKLQINNIDKILNYLILNQGCSVNEISLNIGISSETVRKVILHFYDSPFGGIFIYYEGYCEDVDLSSVNSEIFDNVLKWYIDTSKMDKIPVENFTDKEYAILYSLLMCINSKSVKNLHKFFKHSNNYGELAPKKVLHDMEKLYTFNFYKHIKNSILNNKVIKIEYENKQQHFDLILKPLGIVFNNENGFWYLTAQNEEGKIYPYRLERIISIKILAKTFSVPDKFNLNHYFDDVWGMEIGNEEYVCIIFKNEGNVVERALKKLKNKGNIRYDKNGYLVFEGEIKGIYNFESWIRGFGSSALVVKPKWLKEKIIQSYKKVVDNYKDIDTYIKLIENTKNDQKNFYSNSL